MIYCIEDDSGIRDIEVYTLTSTGFSALGFEDAETFFLALKKEIPELIILDVMLPGKDGIEILRELKVSPDYAKIPVIMATAKGTEYDKINGLDLGADDYLVKPFGMMEMVSRVRAVLRRTNTTAEITEYKNGGLTLDTKKHTVFVKGEKITLTLKEFDLLALLMANPGIVYSRDVLLAKIWDFDYDGETRTVDVHVRSLRSKLGECGNLIETVRGVGYKMEVAAK